MTADDDLTFEHRLLDVQKLLNAPKNRKNSFGNYSYRSAEDILEAVKPLLHDYGLTLTLSDDIVERGGRVYVQANATLSMPKRDTGSSSLTVTAFAREEETKKGMDAAQITGSASSYARKYALNGLFLIDDDKDPDTDEYERRTHDAPQKPQNAPQRTEPAQGSNGTSHADKPITDVQKKMLYALAGEIAEKQGWPKDWLKPDLYQYFNVDSTVKMTTAQGAHAIRALYAVKDKNAVFIDALQTMKGA